MIGLSSRFNRPHLSVDRPVERLVALDATVQWGLISQQLMEVQRETGCDLLISTYSARRDGWLANRLAMLVRSGFDLDRLFMATPSPSMPSAVCQWVNRHARIALERRHVVVIVSLRQHVQHWPLGFYSPIAAGEVTKDWLVRRLTSGDPEPVRGGVA